MRDHKDNFPLFSSAILDISLASLVYAGGSLNVRHHTQVSHSGIHRTVTRQSQDSQHSMKTVIILQFLLGKLLSTSFIISLSTVIYFQLQVCQIIFTPPCKLPLQDLDSSTQIILSTLTMVTLPQVKGLPQSWTGRDLRLFLVPLWSSQPLLLLSLEVFCLLWYRLGYQGWQTWR